MCSFITLTIVPIVGYVCLTIMSRIYSINNWSCNTKAFYDFLALYCNIVLVLDAAS